MKTLKNISEHRPKGMLIDVAEEDAKAIIKTGEFIENTKENLIVTKKPEMKEENPNESWTENEIDKWVEKNAPDIKYYPTKHTKKWILDKLREKNLI